MEKVKRLAIFIVIVAIAIFLAWKNLYSQQALAERVSLQKGFKTTAQEPLSEVSFIFQPSWVPEWDEEEEKEVNELIFQSKDSSIYLTSVSNTDIRQRKGEDEGSIIVSFEIKNNFNPKGGQYLSCWSVSEQGFTPIPIKVTGYDKNNNLLDEDFGSVMGTGPGQKFSIYLRAKDLLNSPIKVIFGPLNIVEYVKD